MQCRPSSSHLQPLRGHTLYTSTIWLAATPRAFHFGYAATAPAEFTPYGQGNQGVRDHPTSILDPPLFFHSIFSKTFPHGGPQLYINVTWCDSVADSWVFFFLSSNIEKSSMIHLSKRTIPKPPEWPAPRETLASSRSMPSMGRCPKKRTIWFWVMERQRTRKRLETHHVFVWWRVHILEIIKILVQLI